VGLNRAAIAVLWILYFKLHVDPVANVGRADVFSISENERRALYVAILSSHGETRLYGIDSPAERPIILFGRTSKP